MTTQEDALLLAVAIVLCAGGALAGYLTGCDPGRRRRVGRILARPESLVTAVLLLAVGPLGAHLVAPSPAVARRYADYLRPATDWHDLLAFWPVLPVAGLLLLAAWASARRAGAGPGRSGWWRHAVGVAGAAVVVAGVVVWYPNRWGPPVAIGWFSYSPLSGVTVAPPFGAGPTTAALGLAAAAMGLAGIAADLAYRAGVGHRQTAAGTERT